MTTPPAPTYPATTAELPVPVVVFVTEFDHGRWPNLAIADSWSAADLLHTDD